MHTIITLSQTLFTAFMDKKYRLTKSNSIFPLLDKMNSLKLWRGKKSKQMNSKLPYSKHFTCFKPKEINGGCQPWLQLVITRHTVHVVCGALNEAGVLGVASVSLKGSDSRGVCSRDSSVVRRMLLSESKWLNLVVILLQQGMLLAKSDKRWPLKIM